MTGDGEPARILLPYLQRADELQKHDHLVAYYCKSLAPLCLLSLSLSLSLFLSLSLSLCISRALVLQLRIVFFSILLRACGGWLDQGFCIMFSNLSSRFCLCVIWRYGGVENCWDKVVHHTFLLFVCGNCGAGRLYAMEKGLKIPVKERTKETNALLTSLMNQLEKVHLSTRAAVCLSATRLCLVLVVVAPIAGVEWLLNLTVYVFMQALWWSRGLSVARSNLHCFSLEHCLFMLLLSVTSILTYGVSVPLVWWSSWWEVFLLLELREMVLLWSEFFSSISLHMLILLLLLQSLVWQSSCLIVRFWFCCNWENGKLRGVVVKFSARGSISYICDAQWSVVFGLWFILLPTLWNKANHLHLGLQFSLGVMLQPVHQYAVAVLYLTQCWWHFSYTGLCWQSLNSCPYQWIML